MDEFPRTERTRIRRLNKRAVVERERIHAVLDAGFVCHVGYVIDSQPYVTPTSYWRDGDRLFWHGSSASKMLRALKAAIPVCVTVSHVDGIVLARSGMHSSINYRCVMAFGRAEEVVDPAEKEKALEAFVERLTPGRWAELRPVTAQELKATTVLTMPLEEVACKIRPGGPVDDDDDYALPIWAGVVPLRTEVGAPVPDPRNLEGVPEPGYLKHLDFLEVQHGLEGLVEAGDD